MNVTREDPADRLDPVPELSHVPATVQDPVVIEIVPEMPPVIATFVTPTAEVVATSAPALPIEIAPPTRPKPLVANVVVPVPPATVRVPDQTRACVLMVNVTVEEPPVKVTLRNSGAPPGRAAKTIVLEAEEAKATDPVPADQLAEVELFVHEPPKDQDAPPKEKYPAALTVMFPVMLLVPDAPERIPPESAARDVAVRSYVSVLRVPVTVREDAVRLEPRETVPLAVKVAKAWPAAVVTVFEVPVSVTALAPAEKVPDVLEVSQFPPIERDALFSANVAVAPEESMSPETETFEELFRTRAFVHVRFEPIDVVTDAFTVKLYMAWGTLIVPEEAETTTVEVPELNAPALVFIEVTVRVLPRALSWPWAATVTEGAVTERLLAEVSKIVFPVGLGTVFVIVRELPTRRLPPDAVYVGPALPPESRMRL